MMVKKKVCVYLVDVPRILPRWGILCLEIVGKGYQSYLNSASCHDISVVHKGGGRSKSNCPNCPNCPSEKGINNVRVTGSSLG